MNWLKDPKNRVKAAFYALTISVVAWPITSLTVFRNEPQGVLALSWLAIIIEMVIIAVTTDVRNNQ